MQYLHQPLARLGFIVFFSVGVVAADPANAQTCVGDCNNDHRVVVSELVTGVNIALNGTAVDPCRNMDADNSGRVAVNELVAAVNSLLRGCPATFTPTLTLTPTQTLSPTRTQIPTLTPTATLSVPPEPSATPTQTPTFTPSPSATPSPSPTPTPEPPTLVVQINPNPVVPGSTMLASLTVTNRRTVALVNTVVRAVIPANNVEAVVRQYIAGGGTCPANSCTPGATITWALGALAAGTSRTVSFPLTVLSGQNAPADGTNITVTGNVTADNSSVVNDSATTVVDSAPPLALSIDADKDAVPPGGTLRYSVYFGNQGVTPQNGATLTLDLPPSVTATSISDGGMQASGIVAWDLGTLAAGTSGVREVIVRVADDVHEGQALHASSDFESTSEAAHASIVSHVEAGAALTLSIDANPDPIAPGDPMIVSMTVTNRGLTDLTGTVVGFRIPPFTLGTSPAYMNRTVTCTLGASFGCDLLERAFWNIGTLPAGDSITLTYPITVATAQSAPPPGALIVFDADVVADGGVAARSNRSVAVRATRVLDLEIDANPNPVAPGTELHYVLSLGNRSVTAMTQAVVTFPVPEGTTFVSADEDGTEEDGIVTWSLGNLAAGASVVRNVIVRVDSGLTEGEPIRANAVLATSSAATRAATVTEVQHDVPLTLNISASPDPVRSGETMSLTLTVTNHSLVGLFGVAAEIRVPIEVVSIEPSFSNEAISCRAGATFSCDNLERALWTVGDLAAGQTRTLTLPTVIKSAQNAPPSGTVISFDGYATANDGSATYAERSVLVRDDRPLEVEIDANPEPVGPGEDLHYRIIFGHRGLTVLANASLEFAIPQGTTFASASNGGVATGDTVRWELGNLAPGTTGVYDVVVEVDQSAMSGTPLLSTATLSAAAAQARTSAVTPVESGLPLTINVAVGPDPVAAGNPMAISVVVTNRGPVTLFDLVGYVRIPPEVALVAPAFTNGNVQCRAGATFSCDNSELAVWTIGNLAAGQGTILTIPTTVLTAQNAPPPGSVITWTALATANDGSQVFSHRSVPVTAARQLDLELDANPHPVAAGADLTYTLTFGNRSLSALSGATLELPMPPGTSFESASDGGTVEDDVVTWTLGDLAAGASGVREVVLTVDGNAVPGTPIVTRALLTTATVEARADSVTRVESGSPLALTVGIDPDPVTQGQTLLVTFTIRNDGLVPLFSVNANLRVPPEVTPFSTATTGGGQCRSGASFACDNFELVLWAVSTVSEGLAPGASVTFTAPPPVPVGPSAPPDGTVITFEAGASATGGSNAYTRASVRVQ